MRRFALLLAASGLLGWGAAGALGACGGDAGEAAAQHDSGGTEESSSGSSVPSGSSSGTSSGDPIPDDASASSSGATPTSNPGKLTCGAAECDAGGGGGGGGVVCCERDAGPVCTFSNNCNGNRYRISCDEPGDCSVGTFRRKCCLRFDNGVADSQQCSGGGGGPGGGNTCGNNGVEICKTAEDCGDAGVCNLKRCGGRELFVCGSPASCQ
jgi:hypothetical protein